jgi:signal transduction histidine kinase
MSAVAQPDAAGAASRLWTGLSGRMILASGLLMLILVAPFGVLLVTIEDLRATERTVRDSESFLDTANELERLVVDLETGVRGFVITGSDQFLQPWNTARADLPAKVDALVGESAGQQDQNRRARQIAEAASSYVQDYAVPLVSMVRSGDPAARSVAETAEGRRRLDAIRSQFTDLIAAERGLSVARQQQIEVETDRAVVIAVGGLALSLVLVLGYTGYLTRAIVQPVRRAGQMAIRLAGGDLDARMPATGVAEIGRLQRAFNQMAGSLRRHRDQLADLAAEQAALRRVATLVARGVTPAAVFAAVAGEVGRLLPADRTYLGRYTPDDTVTIVAAWSATGDAVPVGLRRPLGSVSGLVRETGGPVRIDDYPSSAPTSAAVARELGVRAAVAAPVTVEGRLWGLMIFESTGDEPPPPDTESRLVDFIELMATAIANAEAQAELTASRARIVASADETRRRIERDLHDGAQQQLVSLALQVRAAQAAMPPEHGDLQAELDRVAVGLTSALDDLREISRGIHPAHLTEGGLPPALSMLARRSPVPVTVHVRAEARLPERIEVAAYYLVSEALANIAKHAEASTARVDVRVDGELLTLAIRDDGVGGADPTRGSGLIGLRDRVEAAGGTLTVDSRPGKGTSLVAEIPITREPPGDFDPRPVPADREGSP